MESITLTRSTASDPWIEAVARDYSIPEEPHVFVGTGLHGERVAFWIGKDGGGFGCIDSDPDGYVRLSAAFASEDKALINVAMRRHGGVDEYEFEEGTFRYNAKSLTLDTFTSFGGI